MFLLAGSALIAGYVLWCHKTGNVTSPGNPAAPSSASPPPDPTKAVGAGYPGIASPTLSQFPVPRESGITAGPAPKVGVSANPVAGTNTIVVGSRSYQPTSIALTSPFQGMYSTVIPQTARFQKASQ